MKKYSYMFPNNKPQYECGWWNLIDELLNKITDIDIGKLVRILQIKEKFGTLRVYISGGTEEIENLIDEYEEKSEKTCEICEKPGKLTNTNGWYSTLCDDCMKKRSNNA